MAHIQISTSTFLTRNKTALTEHVQIHSCVSTQLHTHVVMRTWIISSAAVHTLKLYDQHLAEHQLERKEEEVGDKAACSTDQS